MVAFETRAGEMEYPINSRVPRRIELRQGDFDPDMGGLGWTEHCPKCTRARTHGWHKADKFKHNEACRRRVQAELAQTVRGRARLELTSQRRER